MSFRSIITLANSIIGVAILSMPYCFKQCGIILATVMILFSGILVKVSCHLLLKSALLARRRNFENLAFHTFGNSGKLFIELGIIGYLVGTTIAFFVVMGDLGPPIISNLAEVENNANLRLVILTCLGLFVALPLSLVRNISSLQHICAASIGFYCCVVLRVVLEAVPNISSGQWTSEVNLWRPAGMLQCFPIFSMALACQTNVFEVYAELPDATPAKMTEVVKGAVNLCTTIYITIGFFGYVAFCFTDFGGDILTSFSHTTFIQTVKLGFCISVALSFPLVMFPCRTSVHSLLFRKTYQGIGSTELVTDYIPPARFNIITGCLIVFCLIIGILIPDIELVLGFVGSTMGASVCVIFPGMIFLKLTNKDTTERLAARAVVVIGVITLILGSYVNLEEASRTSPSEYPNRAFVQPAVGINDVNNQQQKPIENADGTDIKDKIEKAALNVIKNISSDDIVKKQGGDKADATRVEPAVPEEPKVADIKIEDTEAKVKDSGEDTKKVKDLQAEVPIDRVDRANDNENNDQLKVKIKKDEKKDEVNAEKLLQELQRQKEESDKILEKQKEILKELEEHKKQDSAQNYAKSENHPPENNDINKNIQGISDSANQQNDVNQDLAQNQQVEKVKQMIIPIEEVKQESLQGKARAVQQKQVSGVHQQHPNGGIQQQQNVPQQQHNVPQQQQQQNVPQQQKIVSQQQNLLQQQQNVPQQQLNEPQQQQIVPQQRNIPQQQQNVIQNPAQQQQKVEYKSRIATDGRQSEAGNQMNNVQSDGDIKQFNNNPPVAKQNMIVDQQHQMVINQHSNNPPIEARNWQQNNNFKQNPVDSNKGPTDDHSSDNQIKMQLAKNPPNQRKQQDKVGSASNPLAKDVEQYNIKADIKQGLAAYDQEQRDLIHPLKTDNIPEGKVPGRDLKDLKNRERFKRSATEDDNKLMQGINCENDPFCSEKFSRDPVGDSLVDRDLTKFLQVGSRALLEVQSDNNTVDQQHLK